MEFESKPTYNTIQNIQSRFCVTALTSFLRSSERGEGFLIYVLKKTTRKNRVSGHTWFDCAEDFSIGSLALALGDDELVGSYADGLTSPDSGELGGEGVVAVSLLNREGRHALKQPFVELTAEGRSKVIQGERPQLSRDIQFWSSQGKVR